MKKPRRASLGIATALITTLVATTGQTTRAQADNALANITGFQTTNISISSEGCKAVPVTMYVSTTDPSSFTSLLTTHIYRNGREVDYTWFSENKPDTWLWCSSNGFGTFRLGPSDGSVYTDSGTYAIHDSTVGYVKVKTKSIQSVTRTSRYRGYVWVSGVSYGYNTRSWFGPTYVRWGGAKVALQYRMPSWKFWKNATAGYANATGEITLKAYAPTGRYWRLVSQESGSVWGSGSGQAYR